MSDPYSIEAAHEMRTRVWATRDGCFDHYPRRCPPECPNAGKHDVGLAELGACGCHQCRLTAVHGEINERHHEKNTTVADEIEQIDRMLFDAGVLALQVAGKRGIAVDNKITDARVRLEQLRARLT